jgi:hypothetical protein
MESTLTTSKLLHKHQNQGGAVRPSYSVVSVDLPNPTQLTFSEGVGGGRFGLVQFTSLK